MIGTIFTFYLCEAILCGIVYVGYRFEKERELKLQSLRDSTGNTINKLQRLNESIESLEQKTKPKLRAEDKIYNEIEKALNSYKTGLIFTDKDDEIFKTSLDDYLIKLHRRY